MAHKEESNIIPSLEYLQELLEAFLLSLIVSFSALPTKTKTICHDLERISRVPDFFVIFIKHGYYFSGS